MPVKPRRGSLQSIWSRFSKDPFIRMVAPTFVFCVLQSLSFSAAKAEAEVIPHRLEQDNSKKATGNGDGRIHVIPTLSSPSVKNGGKITISAVVKAQAGVAKVEADLGGVETIELKPAPNNLGGVNSLGTLGLYTAEWTAHDLEEKVYSITLRVTDNEGHTFTDQSLSFSDPAAGNSNIGSTNYPTGGMRRIGADTLDPGENQLLCAVIDTANDYAYFGTSASPGIVVKVALGTGGDPPTRVGELTLDTGENGVRSGVLDEANGYAYFGTNTDPGRVVKVALGSGDNPPTRVDAVTLNSGESYLSEAVIDTGNAHAYFGTNTSPAIVIKIALGSGSNPPTRVGPLTLNTGENQIQSAVIDTANGYAYFGHNYDDGFEVMGSVVKVALGSGSNPPTRVGAVIFNPGEEVLESAVLDAANGYAYFGTTGGFVVKVALGSGSNPPTRVGAVTLNPGEIGPRCAVLDAANGYAYFGTVTTPGSVVKVALGTGNNSPSRVAAVPLNAGEISLFCAVSDIAAGYAYFGTFTSPGNVIKVSLSQKNTIKGTKITLAENANAVNDVHFYSHANSGNLRLAIYDDGSPKNLLWDSGSVGNTVDDNWLTIPISSGTPSSQSLIPGTYWLAWQTDSAAGVPSYTLGSPGDGFYLDQLYGAFPATIPAASITATSEKWSEYITYDETSTSIGNWRLYD